MLEVYRQLYHILQLPAVQQLVVILFTFKMGFSAAQDVTPLKLMEYGMPKEHMASLATPITLIVIVLPMVISARVANSDSRPLELIGDIYVPRLLIGMLAMPLVYSAGHYFPIAAGGELPLGFYAACFVVRAAAAAAAVAAAAASAAPLPPQREADRPQPCNLGGRRRPSRPAAAAPTHSSAGLPPLLPGRRR